MLPYRPHSLLLRECHFNGIIHNLIARIAAFLQVGECLGAIGIVEHVGRNTGDIPGIPAYVLYNADGTEAFSNLQEGGYPGNEIVNNAIEVALSQKK